MKTLVLFISLFISLFADDFIYSIGNSKIINGNTLVFTNRDSGRIIKLPIHNQKIDFSAIYNGNGKSNILYKFMKPMMQKKTIYTIPEILNFIATKRDIYDIKNKNILILKGDRIYYGKIHISQKDGDSIFEDMITLTQIKVISKKYLDLDSYEIVNYPRTILSLSKHRGNILSFRIFDNIYKLKYTTNRYLKEFLYERSKIIKNFYFYRDIVTLNYVNRKNNINRKVVYKKDISKKPQAIVVELKDINKKLNRTKISNAELYDLKDNLLLFQLYGSSKNNFSKIYSFTQFPSSRKIEVKSKGSSSEYYRKSIYYYNKAGIWYLASWLKKHNIDNKIIYLFNGDSNAKIYKIKKHDGGFIINNNLVVEFFKNSSLIKRYGEFKFVKIETNKLKTLKRQANIIKVY